MIKEVTPWITHCSFSLSQPTANSFKPRQTLSGRHLGALTAEGGQALHPSPRLLSLLLRVQLSCPKTRSVRPTGVSPACRGLGGSPEEKSRGLSAACWTRLLCFLPVRRNQRQRDGMCGEKGRGAPGMLLRGPGDAPQGPQGW